MQLKLRRRNLNEVLLSNRIDNEFNTIMLPSHVMQQITFDQKYRIRDNFITSNGNITNLIAFCILICIIAGNWYQYLTTEYIRIMSKSLQRASIVLTFLFEPIVILVNLLYTVRYSNTHVTLLLKLQRLAKFTKYSNYKDITISNWVGVIFFLTYHVGWIIYVYSKIKSLLWSLITLLLINSYIFYTSQFVNLLRRNLVLWTDKIIELEVTIRVNTDIERVSQTEMCAELFNYFKDILEAFSLVKRMFKLMVRIKSYETL